MKEIQNVQKYKNILLGIKFGALAMVVSLAAMLATGCKNATVASPAPESNSMPEKTEPHSTPGPSAEPEIVLDYDEIRLVPLRNTTPQRPCTGYFTVCRDGKWGLIRADGTELLPCLADVPVSSCGWHWMWNPQVDWETLDDFTAALQATGDGEVCMGHGFGSFWYFWDVEEECLRRWDQSESGWGACDPTTLELTEYGAAVPAIRARVTEEGEETDLITAGGDLGAAPGWIFCHTADGTPLNAEVYERAGRFDGEALAPCMRGDFWGYLDEGGQLCTEMVYSAVYGSDSLDDPQPALAAPLQNGYAAVCRDGRWGVLDDSGAECVPCTCDGAAWDGSMLWLKQEDGLWRRSELP